MTTCHYCGESKAPEELRPYGPDGAAVCFGCAMKPENKATTEATFKAQLDAAGPTPVLDPAGVGPRPATLEDVAELKRRRAHGRQS